MTKESLSSSIVRLRKERGWSQEKLAQEADVSYHTIFRSESGTIPKTENLQKIAKAFGLSLTELLEGGQRQENEIQPRAARILALQSILSSLSDEDFALIEAQAKGELKVSRQEITELGEIKRILGKEHYHSLLSARPFDARFAIDFATGKVKTQPELEPQQKADESTQAVQTRKVPTQKK